MAKEYRLKVSAQGVDEFAKAAVDAKDRLDDLGDSALRVTGFFGRLYTVARLIPGAGMAISTAMKATSLVIAMVGATAAGATAKAMQWADALTTISDRSQVARENLQALAYGADGVGTSFERLTQVMEAISQVQGELRAGIGRSSERVNALKVLGLDEGGFASKESSQVMRELISKMEDGKLSTEQRAAAVFLFGDAIKDVNAAAQNDLGKLLKMFDALHLGVSERATDTFAQLDSQWKQWAATASAAISKVTKEYLALEIARAKGVAGSLPVSPLVGYMFPVIRGVQNRWLREAAEYSIGGTGKREAEAEGRQTQDARDAAAREARIGKLKDGILRAAGEKGPEILEDLAANSARERDYERALREAKRSIGQDGMDFDFTPEGALDRRSFGASTDALARIGLFRGDGGTAHRTLTKLEGIRKEIADLRADINRE